MYHSLKPLKTPDEQTSSDEDAYVGLVLGAVSGIASAVGKIKTKKQRRSEASQAAMANILQAKAYQAQQAQIAAELAAQVAAKNKAKNQARAKQMELLLTTVGIGLIGIALLLISRNHQAKILSEQN